jgi:hypothetical protein
MKLSKIASSVDRFGGEIWPLGAESQFKFGNGCNMDLKDLGFGDVRVVGAGQGGRRVQASKQSILLLAQPGIGDQHGNAIKKTAYFKIKCGMTADQVVRAAFVEPFRVLHH